MPDLRNLEYLEEIIINNAGLEDSAYPSLANPNMHTLKMHTARPEGRTPVKSANLTGFFSRCGRLRNLKLDLRPSPPPSSLWSSLVAAQCLKQLCLAAADTPAEDVLISLEEEPELLESISRVAEKIELAHIHFSLKFVGTEKCPFYLHDVVRDKMFSKSNNARALKEFVGPDEPCLAQIDSLEGPPTYCGRGLCTLESFIARMSPIGWSAD